VGTHQERYRYREEQQHREERIQEIREEELYLEEGKVGRVVVHLMVVGGTAKYQLRLENLEELETQGCC